MAEPLDLNGGQEITDKKVKLLKNSVKIFKFNVFSNTVMLSLKVKLSQ